ncbi:MAG TPA: T9SS type A sorting domain-containing protein [candidate division WOR-3 bacterium]|uniref:T9SS type A sorting domain-containing protein n=1 Tax=candidate division WOR-3 bacterium TaxID=2052148 RepID=A0A9C9ENR2_UNCW3|nr:T9SS type A sorting domain-containing protein [candidate division WOR-3 bacterium]
MVYCHWHYYSYTMGGGYTLDYSPIEFSFYKENGFDRIRSPKFNLHGEPGTPELPAVYLNYIIPPNVKAESIIVSHFQLTQIPGEYLIYPAQPSRIIGESLPWVPPDTIIYNSDSFVPDKFIKISNAGVMDGARIVTIEFRPLQYRPKTKRLYLVRSVQFEFIFSQSSLPNLRPQIRGRYEQAVYDAVIRYIIENDYEVPRYYQSPTIVEENEIGTLAPVPGAPGVIIAPVEFHNAFQPYADWMTDQGTKTILITPEYIYSHFEGCDNPERIRNYIKWCYQHAGGTYFILGGDQQFLPVRYCYPCSSDLWWGHPGYQVPTDFYFAELTGNWNADGDEKWGEPTSDDSVDKYAEVFVGRITAYNTAEVTNWVNKVFTYEKTPGNYNLTASLWIRNTTVSTGDAWEIFPPSFDHIWLNDCNPDEVLEFLNIGFGFCHQHCHGTITTFKPKAWQKDSVCGYMEEQPNSYGAGLNFLDNTNEYYVNYSIACYNGGYDTLGVFSTTMRNSDTCICDGFVDAYSNKGACAFLGNTRFGWGPNYSTDLEYEFYSSLFSPYIGPYPPEPSLSRLGISEALSKCGQRIDWEYMTTGTPMRIFPYVFVAYTHTLFGSPYTEVWTNQPRNFSVSHMRSIFTGVQYQFQVEVKDAENGAPVVHAKVCLNKLNDIYEVGYTDNNGKIIFTITARTHGQLKVTVTRIHDNNTSIQYYPSETYCQVFDASEGGQTFQTGQITPISLCITQIPTYAKQSLTLKFGVPKVGDITISLYDATGSKIGSSIMENLIPGFYQQEINVKSFSNGVYFIVLKQNNEQVARKFLLIK